MKETIHCLYLFIQNDTIFELGVATYNAEGSDENKIEFLKSRAFLDYKESKRFNIPKEYLGKKNSELHYRTFIAMQRQGIHLDLFEKIFEYYDSPSNPLVNITPIVDGKPKVDIVTNNSPLQGDDIPEGIKQNGININDYLIEYTTDEGFDLPKLLNDDYFISIKLLFNHGLYVSCCKLLLSFIDTIAFLAYGDTKDIFKKWLNEYADLNDLGITSTELWELRNSLLHMTNLDSRKVLKGKVKRLMFYVGNMPENIPKENEEAKYFNLKDLIDLLPSALEKWAIDLNSRPLKLSVLIERYDLIISDARKSHFVNI
jgi:hypothetical protein